MQETVAIAEFAAHFGRPPEVGARAPGRVNLIGEHTDYNDGLVLPCAIDRDTTALASLRSDGRFRAFAYDLGEVADFDPRALERRGSWIDYVQAVVFAFTARGFAAPGLDLMIHSNLPREAGLSSSAALGVAVATAIDEAAEWNLEATAIAQIVHAGECEFVGVGCGILDQFASALGKRGHALRIDCQDESIDAIALPASDLRLLLTDSGVRRVLAEAGSGYRARVFECNAALEAARDAGVVPTNADSLRAVGRAELLLLESKLDPILFRRTRHVVKENGRVDDFCRLLRDPRVDPGALGDLLCEGHRSLRDDYEVSVSELDLLCEIAAPIAGVFGSRLTGAGFGGWVLHLVDGEAAEEIGGQISREFQARVGRPSEFTIVTPSDGASRIEL